MRKPKEIPEQVEHTRGRGGLFVFVLIAAIATGLLCLVFAPAIPSLVSSAVVPVQAQNQVATISAPQTTVITMEVPVGSSVLVVDGQEFVEELHRHDEEMSAKALDTVAEVSASGDTAQMVQAIAAAIQGSVLGCGILVALGLVVFVLFKFGNRGE